MFCLLEATRVKSIAHMTKLQTELAGVNVFGAYDNELWTDYHCLGRNISDLESDMIKYASAQNTKEQFSFLNFSMKEVSDFKYVLFTDGKGSLFIKNISNYMKEHFMSENIQDLYSGYQAIKGLLENGEFDMEKMDNALEALKNTSYLEEVKESEKKEQADATTQTEIVSKKNPIDEIKKLQKKGILKLVLKDSDTISEKAVNLKKSVSNRSQEKGTLEIKTNIEWMDTLLFQQYLFRYFSCYANEKENRILDYELEYLIGQKESDVANLKAVINKILLTRQAVNMLYLLNDAEKMNVANSAALGLLAVGVPPAITEAVKLGIVAAWAYAESILDLRTLLAGKKIPLMKSDNLWTLQLEEITKIGEGFLMAKESKNGISYENYLRLLLFFETEKDLAFHAMDIIEKNIQQKDADFYLDNMVIGSSYTLQYEYQPLFSTFQFLSIHLDNAYVITNKEQFFYGYH